MKLVAIVGSVTAPGRLIRAITQLLDDTRAAHDGVETQLIDLADLRIAFADGRPPEQYQDDTAAVVRSVREAEAVILASPVYRGSITGALKNLLDHLPPEALSKPVGIVAMGATLHHFLGADRHLRDILSWFGAIVVPVSVYLVSSDFAEGKLSDEARQELSELADAALKLVQVAPAPGKFLGPKPLPARRK